MLNNIEVDAKKVMSHKRTNSESPWKRNHLRNNSLAADKVGGQQKQHFRKPSKILVGGGRDKRKDEDFFEF